MSYRFLGMGSIFAGLFMFLGFLSSSGSGPLLQTAVALLLFTVAPVALGIRLLRHDTQRKLAAARQAELAVEAEVVRLAGRQPERLLSASELVVEMGLDVERAERLLEDLARKGAADPQVTDDGTILYYFAGLPGPEQRRGARNLLED